MMGIEEGIEFRLLTVDGQGVLGQIVRTDAEEVDFFSQFFTHDGSRRRFDHNADFHILIVGNPFRIQFPADFVQDFFALLYFPDGNNHGEHDGNLTECRGTQQGAELCLEQIDAAQADADSPHAHGRVFFRIKVEIVNLFIGTDIEGPNDDSLAFKGFCRLLIGFELLIFRRIVAAFQIEEFAAEKTDAFSIIGQNLRQVARIADIGKEIDLLAVFGNRRDTAHLFQSRKAQFFFFLLFSSSGPAFLHQD